MVDNATNKSVLHVVPPADPFDPTLLRLDQSYLEGGASKKLLTNIPVRKPSDQDYFRVHPDPEFRMTAALIVLKDDRESYLVTQPLVGELVGEWQPYVLFTTINRQGVVAIWAIRLPGPDGRQNDYWRTAHDAAERAMKDWIRIKANMSAKAYDVYESIQKFPDPDWPAGLAFNEMLRIAFRDRLVDHVDHPVLKRLRGAV
jgi:hypothetical protein